MKVGEFVGNDLKNILKQDAKRGLSVILIGQDYGAFHKKDIDLVAEIQNNTGTFVSFQQKELQDSKELGEYFAMPMLDLSERLQPMVVPIDPETRKLVDRSYGIGSSTSRSDSTSAAAAESVTTSKGQQSTDSRNWATGSNLSSFESHGQSDSVSQHPIVENGQIINLLSIPNSSQHGAAGQATGASHSEGGGSSNSLSFQHSTGQTQMRSQGHAKSVSNSRQESVTYKTVLVPQHEIRDIPSGQPTVSIELQNYRVIQQLNCLPMGQAFVRTRINGHEVTFRMNVLEVEEPYETWKEYVAAITAMKSMLTKAYHRQPQSLTSKRDQRIRTEYACAN